MGKVIIAVISTVIVTILGGLALGNFFFYSIIRASRNRLASHRYNKCICGKTNGFASYIAFIISSPRSLSARLSGLVLCCIVKSMI